METNSFSFDVNAKKLKEYIHKCFSDKQLEDIINLLAMYIEVRSSEEMSNRLYNNKTNPNCELELIWIVSLWNDLKHFLKNCWQK